MQECITMQHVITAADNIVELGRRCYLKARDKGQLDMSNGHRSSTLDHLEGLKSVLIVAQLSDSNTYHYVNKLWSETLDWP